MTLDQLYLALLEARDKTMIGLTSEVRDELTHRDIVRYVEDYGVHVNVAEALAHRFGFNLRLDRNDAKGQRWTEFRNETLSLETRAEELGVLNEEDELALSRVRILAHKVKAAESS